MVYKENGDMMATKRNKNGNDLLQVAIIWKSITMVRISAGDRVPTFQQLLLVGSVVLLLM